MTKENSIHEPLAIVGIGCRLPGGADDPQKLWELLCEGFDGIVEVPHDRWDIRRFYSPNVDQPGKMCFQKAGFIQQKIDEFDAQFFNISPREAEVVDPQQRLLLETSWEAMEDAGIIPAHLKDSNTGVYIGSFTADALSLSIGASNRELISSHSATGLTPTILSARLSYFYDLKGPCLTADTACSSALVTFHLACQAIWHGECEQAIAGAVNLLINPTFSLLMSQGHFLSPLEQCRSFDKDAKGYVRSEGCGLVIIKKMSDAIKDKNPIYALVHGTGINQDGRTEGLPVPSKESQTRLIKQVQKDSGVTSDQIQYIEAHGTGTAVGDPIEVEALHDGLSSSQLRYIGSIKSNIGHTESTAGIAGIIKAALCLKENKIPPNIHFDHLNPKIPMDEFNFKVPTQVTAFPDEKNPPFVGINSFGFGGTNGHAILGQAPMKTFSRESPENTQGNGLPLLLSGRTLQALQGAVSAFRRFLEKAKTNKNTRLIDILYSAALRRTHHEQRLAFMVTSIEDAVEKLAAYEADPAVTWAIKGKTTSQEKKPLAFVYTGIGPQWFGMGRELLATEPRFLAVMQECDRILSNYADFSLLDELNKDEASSKINQTVIAQPALFSIQAALTELWKSRGVTPDIILGHSIGELAAAYAAGALTLEEALFISVKRSRVESLAEGGMLAVSLPEQEIRKILAETKIGVDIAAVNSPVSVTLTGQKALLQQLADQLTARNIFSQFLRVELPYHSSQLKAFKEHFFNEMIAFDPKTSKTPFYSTVSARKIDTAALDSYYWWQNIIKPVLFYDTLKEVIKSGCYTFLEIGPHPALSTSIQETITGEKIDGLKFHSLHRKSPENQTLGENLLLLHVNGIQIDWSQFLNGNFISLPLYSWQREKYWRESQESMQYRLSLPGHPILARQFQMPDPAWQVEINPQFFDFLFDHQLEGVAVMPGAFYVEAGLAAHRELFGHQECTLEALEFLQPLFLNPKEERLMVISYSPIDRLYRIQTCIALDHQDWKLHAVGKIYDKPISLVPELPDEKAIKARCPKIYEHSEIYQKYASTGMEYTGAFQGIKKLWMGEGETIAEIEYAPQNESPYFLHPATFDSIIQIILMNLGKLLVIQGMDDVHFYRTPVKGTLFAHARILKQTEEKASAEFIAWDSQGVFLHAVNVRVMFMRSATEKAPEKLEQSSFYSLSWNPIEIETPADFGRQPIFIASQQDVLNRNLSSFFASKQSRTIVINNDNTKELLEALSKEKPLQKVYAAYLALENEESNPDLGESANATRFFHFAQQLVREIGDKIPIYLTIVTKGTQFVTEKEKQIHLGASSLWGMLRVIANEHENIFPRLIDLDADQEVDPSQLGAALFRTGNLDEIALREGKWFSHSFHSISFEETATRIIQVDASTGAYQLHEDKVGDVNSLLFAKFDLPPLGPNDVELKVHSVLLNFKDLMNVMGLLDPAITENTNSAGGFGLECSGTVTRKGSNVTNCQIGDKFITCPKGGAFRTYLVIPDYQLYRIPDCASIENPVSYTVAATVVRALKTCAQLRKGETILIHSGAGGVGLTAIQYAQHIGANIIATVGRKEKRDYLHSIGVTQVTDSRSLTFVDDVMTWTNGRGVDVILNSLPDDALLKSWSILAPYGRFLEIGKKDIVENHHLPMLVFNNNTSFFAIDLDRILTDPVMTREISDQVYEAFQEGIFTQLPTKTFPASDIASAFRYMARAEQIGKIAVHLEDEQLSVRETDESPFHADGSYLITGGCSGLGLELAERLAGKGVKTLILIGRHGATTDQAKEIIERLRQNQVQVLVEAVDVVDKKGLEALFEKINREMPTLRGVFHCAGVLADDSLMNQTEKTFQTPLKPKITGAWNLHLLTKDRPLDFFVLYSSFVSLLGNPGQVNYAAGNAFLDSLSYYRRCQGLPALTINWGSFTETGMSAVDIGVKEHLKSMGIVGFSNQHYFYLLDRVLRYKPIQIGILQANFEQLSKYYPTLSKSSMFSSLISHDKTKAKESKVETKYTGKTEEETIGLMEEDLKEIITKVMRIKRESIDINAKLTEMGVDSLLAIEITALIETKFGVKIPVLKLMGGISLKQLAKDIFDRYSQEQQEIGAEPDQIKDIETMSEAEMDRLLKQLL